MGKYGNKEVEDKRELYNKDIGQEFDKAADEVSKGLLNKTSITYGKDFERTTDMMWTVPLDEPIQKPITREEALDYINKRMDSHIFIERNCSSLMNEDQIVRLSKIKEYIKENLK